MTSGFRPYCSKLSTVTLAKFSWLIAAAFIVLVTTPTVVAQDDFDALELLYGDEETVSIATGSSKPLHLAPSVASVITEDDIRAMGAKNLDDALESIPGLHVSLLTRYSSSYSIRGIHTTYNPQVLMLINGYPITELFSGGRAPKFNIPVHNIKRIEIIRGPGSAVYGADAFAGVINIITKDSSDLMAEKIGATVGSFDTRGAWVQTGKEWGEWSASLSLEWEQSDGDPDRTIDVDLQSAFDALFFTNASLAPGTVTTQYDILNSQLELRNSQWKFTLNSWQQNNAGIGSGIANALDASGHQDSEQHLLDIDYNNEDWFDDWRIEGSLNYFNLDQRSYYSIFPAGTVLPIGADGNLNFIAPVGLVSFPDGYKGSPGGEEQTLAGEVVAYYNGLDRHKLRFAAGYKDQETDTVEAKNFGPGIIDGTQPVVDGTMTDVSNSPFVFMRDRDRQNYYASVQNEWSFIKDWELTAGVRFDNYSDFGDTINPRLAAVWQTTYTLTTKFLYGRAFRAPSLAELFSINNPVSLGNPDVDPEQIDTFEISFDYLPNYDIKTRLNLFRYEIDGLINFVPGAGAAGTLTAQNASDQDGHGVEAEASWSINKTLSLSGSVSWQHSEYSDTDQEVPNAPQLLGYVDLRWDFAPKWQVTAQLHHVAERVREAGDPRGPVDDYSLLNLTVNSQRLLNHWDFSLSVHNVLDEEAYEPGAANVPLDHPLAGRSVLFNATYNFSD